MRRMLLLAFACVAGGVFDAVAVPRKTVIWHGWDLLKATTEDVWRNRTKFAVPLAFDAIECYRLPQGQ